jgi:hypothetical protein
MLNLDNLPQNGTVVNYSHRGAQFPVKIVSSRVRYGQIDVQLQPINGTGSFWVRADSVIKSASEIITAL